MNSLFSPQDSKKQESKFGRWHVYEHGEMSFDNGRYGISEDRLHEDDWIAHLFEKGWIDWNEFLPAYFQALKNVGMKHQRIRIFY
jgi:hypothetical protein